MLRLEHGAQVATCAVKDHGYFLPGEDVFPREKDQAVTNYVDLSGLRTAQTKAVDGTGAHVRLGEEDVRAVRILLVVSAHIHSTSQSEDFLGKETFTKCWHPLITIEAYSLAFVLN